MEKHQKKHFWNFALFTRFNLYISHTLSILNLSPFNIEVLFFGIHPVPSETVLNLVLCVRLPRLYCKIVDESISRNIVETNLN